MPARIHIFVNGILTFPGLAANWNRRAVTWTHLHTPHRAESLEYLVTALTRWMGDTYRAKKLARKLEFYLGAPDPATGKPFELVLVGHSNGCDVILDALKLLGWPRLEEVHLISAACDANFERNGLNRALGGEAIGRLHLYQAGRDTALKLAKSLPGRLLGYGALGAEGPCEVDCRHAIWTRIEEVVEPEFGHSDWFAPAHFERTMRRIHFPHTFA